MKKVITLATLVLGILFAVNTAYAIVPTDIDGIDNGEWATYDLFSSDPDEGDINQAWDISAFYGIMVPGVGVGSGLYFRLDTYAAPSWTGDGNGLPAYYQLWLDFTGEFLPDGSSADMLADLNNNLHPGDHLLHIYTNPANAEVYGPGNVPPTVIGLSSIVEGYIPYQAIQAVNPGYWPLNGSTFGVYAALDGRSGAPDDRLPNAGWVTTVPEPASMSLLGLGLLGIVGALRRKKVTA